MKIYPHCLCSIVFLHYFCRKIERGMNDEQNIIIYRTADGRASVALFAKDGKIWLNQQQMAELFATSKHNISMHTANILKDKELRKNSVVKNFLTTAADGKNYNVVFYSLEMIIAIGYRVRGVRGTQYSSGLCCVCLGCAKKEKYLTA